MTPSNTPWPAYDWTGKTVVVTGGAGFRGQLTWDPSKPNTSTRLNAGGQPQHKLDTSRAETCGGHAGSLLMDDSLSRVEREMLAVGSKFPPRRVL